MLQLKTAATITPVSYAEMKAFLRLPDDSEQTLVETLLATATNKVERDTGRKLISQTWKEYFCSFPKHIALELELFPVASVSSVKYYDTNNTQQTLSSSGYSTNLISLTPYLYLNAGYFWPSTYSRPDAVEVEHVAGYGATAASVPNDLRLAIRLLVAFWFEHRDLVEDNYAKYSGQAYEILTSPFRRML